MTLILLIVFILCLLFFMGRPKEGQMVLVFANIGAGKTTLLSRYAFKEQKKIKRGKSKYKQIVSNTPISDCIYVSDIHKLLNDFAPERTLFLIDEGGIVFNNRKMKLTDREIEYLKLIRHYDSKMVIVSQSYDDVDITIRRLYTNMYLLNKFIFGQTLIKPIRKFVTIEEETEQIIDAYAFRPIFSWGFLNRKNYYHMFDTKWKPDGRQQPEYKDFQVIPYRWKLNVYNKYIHPAFYRIKIRTIMFFMSLKRYIFSKRNI
ncbi:hypothetical protein CLHUN_35880 [Ruminiclostridium hungatei]|uniref:Zona occludens toxin N-terminal domain-containing protein n=1 Tax=Ruminiclostridium hungatei TaxID=48256 RepID=A0A1V4SFE3_RUMHU|nr:zonular occludens toxin domain-containing protein [Ruminiclostridium hungatei]OPX42452.1 hypothetical protein CLHUN_35770 [Ruminiclostridium hungatei]OPX42463.1 hypothetical protein CLHUN_35880 [Ruminiclostridium hungatei]